MTENKGRPTEGISFYKVSSNNLMIAMILFAAGMFALYFGTNIGIALLFIIFSSLSLMASFKEKATPLIVFHDDHLIYSDGSMQASKRIYYAQIKGIEKKIETYVPQYTIEYCIDKHQSHTGNSAITISVKELGNAQRSLFEEQMLALEHLSMKPDAQEASSSHP